MPFLLLSAFLDITVVACGYLTLVVLIGHYISVFTNCVQFGLLPKPYAIS